MNHKPNLLRSALIGIVMFLITGCGESSLEPQMVKSVEAGTIIDIEYSPATFSDYARTIIKTDKGVFVIGGTKSFFKGETAIIEIYDNCREYFCQDSSGKCHKIW